MSHRLQDEESKGNEQTSNTVAKKNLPYAVEVKCVVAYTPEARAFRGIAGRKVSGDREITMQLCNLRLKKPVDLLGIRYKHP